MAPMKLSLVVALAVAVGACGPAPSPPLHRSTLPAAGPSPGEVAGLRRHALGECSRHYYWDPKSMDARAEDMSTELFGDPGPGHVALILRDMAQVGAEYRRGRMAGRQVNFADASAPYLERRRAGGSREEARAAALRGVADREAWRDANGVAPTPAKTDI